MSEDADHSYVKYAGGVQKGSSEVCQSADGREVTGCARGRGTGGLSCGRSRGRQAPHGGKADRAGRGGSRRTAAENIHGGVGGVVTGQ